MSTEISIQKDAQRISIYIDESDRWQGKPLYAAILETLKAKGIAGATVMRGVAGFGAHSRIHTASILRLSEDLPLRIEVIDSPEKVVIALEAITPMVREGLITLEDVQVVRYTHRYLNPLPVDRPISSVMTKKVFTVYPEMTIAQAWEEMLTHDIKAMPVISESRQVIGMLTDDDLMTRASAPEHISVAMMLEEATIKDQLAVLQASPLKVQDVMTKPAITALVVESLGTVAARMAKHGTKRLPVVDEEGKLVGVVSRIDILCQVMKVETKPPKFELPAGALQTVDQVMYPEIPAVSPEADLADIVAILVQTGLRKLIVVDQDQRPIGLVNDADVVARIQPKERRGVLAALRGGPAPDTHVTAQALMSPNVLTVSPDTPLVEATRLMLQHKRKWLVVVDGEGKTMGVVDRQILLKAMLD